MGFLNGRVTYVRFRVGGESPLPFGEELLELASQHAIGRHGAGEPNDGISVGWAGGDHVLDTSLDLDKNVVNDALHLAIRVDTDKIPGSLLRAYTKIETDARAQDEPERLPDQGPASGGQGSRQGPRRDRGRRRPVPADGPLPGPLGRPVEHPLRRRDQPVGARPAPDPLSGDFRPDPRADQRREPGLLDGRGPRGEGSRVESLGPIGFIGEDGHSSVAWSDTDVSRPDFWGNEFLIWLWHVLQADGDTIAPARRVGRQP